MSRPHTHKIIERSLSPRARRRLARAGLIALIIASAYLIIVLAFTIIDAMRLKSPLLLGATFSDQYARFLGLDPRATFTALLDEMGVRRFRIPAYWEDIEPNPDEYHFEMLDWMLDEAAKRDAHVLLAVGFKLPRWPECHAPAWAHELPTEERKTRTLAFVRTVVNRYRSHPAVAFWQVENEPLLESFGVCPKPDREFLKQEVSLVRALDDEHPIVVTESGEFSTWLRTVQISDIVGISMYRVSWNQILGYVYYPLSPSFYRRRAQAVRPLTNKVIVTELQAEPWVPAGILQAPLAEQYRSMNMRRLADNIRFVRRAGFDEVYLWGVEWWYWLKSKQSDPSMWEAGRAIFQPEIRSP